MSHHPLQLLQRILKLLRQGAGERHLLAGAGVQERQLLRVEALRMQAELRLAVVLWENEGIDGALQGSGCKWKIENGEWKVLQGCRLRVVGERHAAPGAAPAQSTGCR